MEHKNLPIEVSTFHLERADQLIFNGNLLNLKNRIITSINCLQDYHKFTQFNDQIDTSEDLNLYSSDFKHCLVLERTIKEVNRAYSLISSSYNTNVFDELNHNIDQSEIDEKKEHFTKTKSIYLNTILSLAQLYFVSLDWKHASHLLYIAMQRSDDKLKVPIQPTSSSKKKRPEDTEQSDNSIKRRIAQSLSYILYLRGRELMLLADETRWLKKFAVSISLFEEALALEKEFNLLGTELPNPLLIFDEDVPGNDEDSLKNEINSLTTDNVKEYAKFHHDLLINKTICHVKLGEFEDASKSISVVISSLSLLCSHTTSDYDPLINNTENDTPLTPTLVNSISFRLCESYILRAKIYFARGLMTQGNEDMRCASTLFPNHQELLSFNRKMLYFIKKKYQDGLTNFKSGNYEECIKSLDEALEVSSDDLKLLLLKCKASRLNNNLQLAYSTILSAHGIYNKRFHNIDEGMKPNDKFTKMKFELGSNTMMMSDLQDELHLVLNDMALDIAFKGDYDKAILLMNKIIRVEQARLDKFIENIFKDGGLVPPPSASTITQLIYPIPPSESTPFSLPPNKANSALLVEKVRGQLIRYLTNRGDCYRGNSRYGEAIEDFITAISIADPSLSVFILQGRQAAKSFKQKVSKKYNKDGFVEYRYNNLIIVDETKKESLETKNNIEEEEDDNENMLEDLDPSFVIQIKALFTQLEPFKPLVSSIHKSKKNYPDSTKSITQPPHYQALVRLALCLYLEAIELFNQGDFVFCIKKLTCALRSHPQVTQYLILRGRARLAIANKKISETKFYRKPKNSQVNNSPFQDENDQDKNGSYYMMLGIKDLKLALSLSPGNQEILSILSQYTDQYDRESKPIEKTSPPVSSTSPNPAAPSGSPTSSPTKDKLKNDVSIKNSLKNLSSLHVSKSKSPRKLNHNNITPTSYPSAPTNGGSATSEVNYDWESTYSSEKEVRKYNITDQDLVAMMLCPKDTKNLPTLKHLSSNDENIMSHKYLKTKFHSSILTPTTLTTSKNPESFEAKQDPTKEKIKQLQQEIKELYKKDERYNKASSTWRPTITPKFMKK